MEIIFYFWKVSLTNTNSNQTNVDEQLMNIDKELKEVDQTLEKSIADIQTQYEDFSFLIFYFILYD